MLGGMDDGESTDKQIEVGTLNPSSLNPLALGWKFRAIGIWSPGSGGLGG